VSRIRPKIGVWLDESGVHESVTRAVRRFRPDMRVTRISDPMGRFYSYAIASPVNVIHNIAGDGVMLTEWFPQLFIPQASEVDERWFTHMSQAPLRGSAKKGLADHREAHDRKMRDVENDAADWAAQDLFPYIRDSYGRYNMANVRPVNTYDKTKALQDRLGSEQR